MKRINILWLILAFATTLDVIAKEGDTFTASNADGQKLRFTIINEAEKTCWVSTMCYTADDMFWTWGTITIPETVEGYLVTGIDKEAFNWCYSINTVQLPPKISYIGVDAFTHCNQLTKLRMTNPIPTAVEEVDVVITDSGRVLKAVEPFSDFEYEHLPLYVPSGSKASYQQTPGWNHMPLILEPDEMPPFEQIVFFWTEDSPYKGQQYWANYRDNAYTMVRCGNSIMCDDIGGIPVTAIKMVEGGGSGLIISKNVKRLHDYAFDNCSGLSPLTIPATVEKIGKNIFRRWAYGENKLYVTVDKDNPFYDSRDNCNGIVETATNTLIAGIKTTTIPSSVVNIGEETFCELQGLYAIVIPAHIKSIGSRAYAEFPALDSVTSFIEKPFPIPDNVFYRGEGDLDYVPLYVPKGSGRAYRTTPGWNVFKQIVEMDIKRNEYTDEQGLTYVYDAYNTGYCVDYSKNLKERYVVTADSIDGIPVIGIQENAFGQENWGSENVHKVTCSPSIKFIGKNAFDFNMSLHSIEFAEGLDSIANRAFRTCRYLHTMTFPSTLRFIGDEAFMNCWLLDNVILSSELRYIGDRSFMWCLRMKTLSMEDNVEYIGTEAFYGNTELKSVSLSANLKTLGKQVFNWCEAIENVYSKSLTPFAIDERTFASCVYQNAVLHVPEGSRDIYKETPGWNQFLHIEEYDPTGILEIKTTHNAVQKIHTLIGIQHERPIKGINIISNKKIIICK